MKQFYDNSLVDEMMKSIHDFRETVPPGRTDLGT